MKALRLMRRSNWLMQRLNRWRTEVWFASISPLTRCAVGAYGDFRDSATCAPSILLSTFPFKSAWVLYDRVAQLSLLVASTAVKGAVQSLPIDQVLLPYHPPSTAVVVPLPSTGSSY